MVILVLWYIGSRKIMLDGNNINIKRILRAFKKIDSLGLYDVHKCIHVLIKLLVTF